MNISDFTERLIDADEFNYVRHDTYWCGNVKKDPLTGKYYVWEAKWCAADREGWRPIGSDYESARHKKTTPACEESSIQKRLLRR